MYWIRLREEQAKQLLKNNAELLIEPMLLRRYDLHLETSGQNVYDVKYEEVTTKTGKVKKKLVSRTLLGKVMGASTFYKTKGQTQWDAEFLKTDGNKLIGSFENENKGTNVEVNVSFGDLARYYCLDDSDPMDRLGLEGRKIITYSNGRKRVVKIEKNFHKERIPNNLLAKRDRYVIADYLSVKMVNYLLKWLLS